MLLSGTNDINKNAVKESALDIARGIAITCLVVAHYHYPDSRAYLEPHWWRETGWAILSFLMPLFAFISGYVWTLAEKDISRKSYAAFAAKKFRRLMAPYLGVSFLLIGAKYAAGFVTDLQIPLGGDILWYVLADPLNENYSTILWYLYSMFIVFAVSYPVRAVTRRSGVVMIGAVILSFAPWPRLFCIEKAFQLLPFFWAGVVSGENRLFARKRLGLLFAVSAVVFAAARMAEASGIFGFVTDAGYLLAGPPGIVMVLSASFLAARSSALTGLFGSLGRSAMTIYLYHTLVIGGFRTVVFSVPGLTAHWFVPAALIICCAAVVIPIFGERFILGRTAFTRVVLLGKGSTAERSRGSTLPLNKIG